MATAARTDTRARGPPRPVCEGAAGVGSWGARVAEGQPPPASLSPPRTYVAGAASAAAVGLSEMSPFGWRLAAGFSSSLKSILC